MRILKGYLYLFFFLVSCEEHVNNNVFRTEVNNVGPSGVTFNVYFSEIGGTPAQDFGFEWGQVGSPSVKDSIHYLHKTPVVGTFTFQVQNELIPGVAYHVRAFVKNSDRIVRANEVNFVSQGSLPPIIGDFTPKQGAGLSTITITGDHFSNVATNNLVSVGNLVCKVISAATTRLVVQIPSRYSSGSFPISVSVFNQKVISTSNFILVGPTINSFTPLIGGAGTVVTILGSNFSILSSGDSVRFGSLAALVTSSSAAQLTVIVPQVPLAGLVNLSVTVNQVTAIAGTQFNVSGPTVATFSPTTGPAGTIVTISGSGFNDVLSENTVLFGGVAATVTSASSQVLIVQVPKTSFTGLVNLSVTVNKIVIQANDKFTVEGPQIFNFSPTSQYGGKTITITGKNFGLNPSDNIVYFDGFQATVLAASTASLLVQVPVQVTNTAQISLYVDMLSCTGPIKFTPLSPWVQLQPFSGQARRGATSFTIGSYAYLGLGITASSGSTDLPDFWKYDPSTDKWSKVADFPGTSRAWAFSFTINGKGYVGGGDSYSYEYPGTVFKDLWEYDPQLNTWTQKQNFPSNSTDVNNVMSAFSDGSKAYVLDRTKLYAYDPTVDQWTIHSTTFSGYYTGFYAAVNISGIGYLMISNALYSYNPQSNTWTTLPNFPGNYSSGSGRFTAMSINGKGYFGRTDFYEFDPASNTWTAIPANPYLTIYYSTAFTINNLGYVATGFNSGYLNAVYKFDPNY